MLCPNLKTGNGSTDAKTDVCFWHYFVFILLLDMGHISEIRAEKKAEVLSTIACSVWTQPKTIKTDSLIFSLPLLLLDAGKAHQSPSYVRLTECISVSGEKEEEVEMVSV